MSAIDAAGATNPFSGNSIAPNFTTSQTNAQKINQAQSGGTFSLGTYIAGSGPSLSYGGGGSPSMKTFLWILGFLLVGGGIWWWLKKRKAAAS